MKDYKVGDTIIYKSEQALVDGEMTYFPEPWEGIIVLPEHEDGYFMVEYQLDGGDFDFDLVKRDKIISLK